MLISVTDLNNNTEPLNNYQRPEIIEEVNGAHTLALTSFFVENNPGHMLLAEESTVSLDGYDYKIKQIRIDKDRKEFVAVSTFFDMVGHRQDLIYGGTRTHNEFLTFVFSGTGWTFSTDINESRFIPNFGENSVIELLQILNDAFDCEYQIMPNKHVVFAHEIGPDNDAQYRYGHNVKELSQNTDTYNLRTQITGIRSKREAVEGTEDTEAIPGDDGFTVTYTSPFAEIYGIIKADPVVNDDARTVEEMTEFLKGEITDYPETSIELDSIESSDKEIGERVWVIYEPIQLADGTFMEFQTRVMKKISTIRNGKVVTQSVVIGNAIPETFADKLADAKIEIKKNEKWTRSRIEQTNTMIELAVERFTGDMIDAYALIKLTADDILLEVAANKVKSEEGIADNKALLLLTATNIRAEVTSDIKRVDGSVSALSSSLSLTATAIRSEVDSKVTAINGQISTANSTIIQLSNSITAVVNTSIPGLNGRMNTAESSINIQAGQISSKVAQSDYNGNMLVSMINQTASHIIISASKISLVGAVTVLSEISGNLGSITAGNINIYEEIKVGAGVHLRGRYTGLYFGDQSVMSSSDGNVLISAYGDTRILGTRITFGSSTVDFTGANVIGLGGSGSGTTVRYSSSSKRLYVDVNGVQQGYVAVI